VNGSTPSSAKPRAVAQPEEQTRAWKPDRALLKAAPLPASDNGFALAADEQTVVGAINLRDPSLFRSDPPPPHPQDAADGSAEREREDTTIDFVGALADFDRDEAQATTASAWGDEHTQLYRPQRSHLPPEEATDEFEASSAPAEAPVVGPEPPKVIISSAVLADSAPDPTRAEATRKRRARRGSDTKLGIALCLIGGGALALSVAWRHPRTAPVAHEAFAKVAAAFSSVRGR
jgi:hypothetical protein